MTQEEKQLLLQDLCARLPYHVMCKLWLKDRTTEEGALDLQYNYSDILQDAFYYDEIVNIKPYLRPMSSMTEEEKEELLNLLFDKEAKHFYINGEGLIDGKTSSLMKEGLNYPAFCPINITLYTDWLNAHYFDYRGLIEKGLALEAPKGMYNLDKK